MEIHYQVLKFTPVRFTPKDGQEVVAALKNSSLVKPAKYRKGVYRALDTGERLNVEYWASPRHPRLC